MSMLKFYRTRNGGHFIEVTTETFDEAKALLNTVKKDLYWLSGDNFVNDYRTAFGYNVLGNYPEDVRVLVSVFPTFYGIRLMGDPFDYKAAPQEITREEYINFTGLYD